MENTTNPRGPVRSVKRLLASGRIEVWGTVYKVLSRPAYAFLLLTLISLVLDVAVVLIGVYEINVNNHKFCQVVSPAIANPIARPPDPQKNVVREQQWEWYQRYVHLDRDLGCH